MITSILKRTILFCSFISAGFIAEAQFTFGPEISGGITAATLTAPPAVVNSSNSKTKSNSNLNGSIGVTVAYQFADFWTVNSGLLYQYIQPTFNQNTSPNTIVTDKLNYINIPLEIVHINDQLKKGWYYGVGINFGLGISGQEELATSGLPSISKNVKFDNEIYPQDPNNVHYNLLNLGALGKVGYFFGKMYIGGEANMGLSNINPVDGYKYKINNYSLHIGYMFNRKVVKPETPPADTTTP
ncbi:MAG TPA: outer membrane beta-barrel protein [Ferruginibacter sp.]|jgi:hypothetical protein|nr:outer membrane beta-barrel protein [Ferruginibacter sp.]